MKNTILLFIASMTSLLISSSSALFVPKVYSHQVVAIVCSMFFWFFLLLGYILQYVNKKRIMRVGKLIKSKAVKFFKTQVAKIVDTLMIVLIITFVLLIALQSTDSYIQYICLFGLMFSIHMHFLFNSDVYQYIEVEVRRGK